MLADGLRDELADLHMELRARTPGEFARCGGREQVREDFLSHLTARIKRPGFALAVAEANGLVGCAFGFPARGDSFRRPDSGWSPPGDDLDLLAACDNVFVVTTLLVRSQPQEKDVARRLAERLIIDHHASLGATLVGHEDYASLASLRSWGWQDAGESWGPSSASLSRVLVLPLTERPPTAR
ncbi:hypothetical protein [Streptomyces iconiensis]|uniref:N-acetyltransferase domain-containing protein n=1 Tax=Streptomyces iconiensis TaxID=1384038 RepID=A0ABT7A7Z6_9ACTN|nr:hypothetical protein [Streptomyces iconiensis]MDJ1137187.1 hypothetical protein [Streptomyces iconiensis]